MGAIGIIAAALQGDVLYIILSLIMLSPAWLPIIIILRNDFRERQQRKRRERAELEEMIAIDRELRHYYGLDK